jgi:hypothetical protein
MLIFLFTVVCRSNTPIEEEEEEADDASSEPETDPAEKPSMPGVKELGSDDKDLKIVSLYPDSLN